MFPHYSDHSKKLVLDISNSTFFNKLDIKKIDSLFKEVGGLEDDSFNISKEIFTDESYRINFHYPTNMNNSDAYKFIDSFLLKMKELPLEDVLKIITAEDFKRLLTDIVNHKV